MNYTISETNDFFEIGTLFKEAGLEVKPELGTPEGVVKMWRVDDENAKLIAGGTAQIINGIYVVKHIAVTEDCRGLGVGQRLLGLIEAELIARGAEELWLAGKVPGYYLRFGWEEVDPQNAPPFSKCLTCAQFQTECFPSIMRKIP